MRLIDVLNKIANGELEDGTRVKQIGGWEYIYKKDGDLHHNDDDDEEALFLAGELNDNVEIIEPAPDKDVATKIEEIIVVPDDLRRRISFVEDKLNEVIRAVNREGK